MSVRKRESGIRPIGEKTWRVVVRLRRNGRIEHRQITFEGTKEEARDKRAQLKREIREGKNIVLSTSLPVLKTFGDLIKIYKEKREECSKAHIRKIDEIGNDLGNVDLNFFADRYESYLRLMKIEKSPITNRYRSNATLNRKTEIVKAAFKLGFDLGLLESNPITKTRFPLYKEYPRDILLSSLDKQKLFNIIEKEAPHLNAVVQFAFKVPCRKSELVKMRREDLDMINQAIRVKAENSKNDKGCWKPIPPDMIDYFSNLPSETEYLFYRIDHQRNYVGLGDFHRAWRRCLKLAGIQGFRFHDSRHIAATTLVDNGTPEQVVMTIAGWHSDMLKNYYNREPIKSLRLVCFDRQCDSNVIVKKVV